jgi:hypothetical protein
MLTAGDASGARSRVPFDAMFERSSDVAIISSRYYFLCRLQLGQRATQII